MIFDIRNSKTPLVRDGELPLPNSIIISLNIDHLFDLSSLLLWLRVDLACELLDVRIPYATDDSSTVKRSAIGECHGFVRAMVTSPYVKKNSQLRRKHQTNKQNIICHYSSENK